MMTDQQEKLSTLLDDYRHTDEDAAALDALQADVNQQYTLQRYQMIGDVMRNDLPSRIQLDFAASVRSRLAQEPDLAARSAISAKAEQPSPGFWARFFKPVAGLAVAASVALVAISSLQLQAPTSEQADVLATNDDSTTRVQQLAQTPAVNQAVRVSGNPEAVSARDGMNWKIKRGKPEVQNKLNTYLINHNEYSNSVQGIIPQARVVGFDGNR